MRYLLIALMFVVMTSDTFGQVSGRVIDARTSEPVVGAIVSLLDSSDGRIAVVSTRANGEFRFQSRSQRIRIRHQSYRDTVVQTAPSDLTIALTPTYQRGDEITVTASRVAT
ncbi:MAG TPA: carboxypeptidase regulatory-like domain-containing protein, partial [Candidatus Kapabacteria bacterium]|nr:carboxypeptidase regulatory-like domain-containing protein [Candidatus Kapabacteria bacterium]